MQLAAQVLPAHQDRQRPGQRGVDLARVLAQLGRYRMEAESGVDRVLVGVGRRAAGAGDAVLGHGQAPAHRQLAQPDVVRGRAGRVLEQVAEGGARPHRQLQAHPGVRVDGRARLAAGGDRLDDRQPHQGVQQLRRAVGGRPPGRCRAPTRGPAAGFRPPRRTTPGRRPAARRPPPRPPAGRCRARRARVRPRAARAAAAARRCAPASRGRSRAGRRRGRRPRRPPARPGRSPPARSTAPWPAWGRCPRGARCRPRPPGCARAAWREPRCRRSRTARRSWPGGSRRCRAGRSPAPPAPSARPTRGWPGCGPPPGDRPGRDGAPRRPSPAGPRSASGGRRSARWRGALRPSPESRSQTGITPRPARRRPRGGPR